MMCPLGDGKALQAYMEDGNDFELDEAKTSYTNGWDIVNLATIKMMMEECTVSGMLEETVVATMVGEIKVGFQAELQQVSLETETGTALDLYLDVKAKDAIKNPSVEVQTDNVFIKYVLQGILEEK